jgi:hypothetical protein
MNCQPLRGRRGGARAAISVLALACLGLLMVAAPSALGAQQVISSAGPLTNIYLNDDTSCQADHAGDSLHEFYFPADTHGDCGTFIWAGGAQDASNVYGPQGTADGNPRLPYTLVSQSAVTGSGTSADPYKVVTKVDVGSTGLHITQTDSYVVGDEFYRSDIEVSNSTSSAIDAALYHAGDCFLQDSDFGYGFYDTSGGGIYCSKTANNSPPDRIEGFVPLSSGSNYLETYYASVWGAINGTQFPNTCDCTLFEDNGSGLSWSITVPANGSVTRSLLTAFSPTGQPPPPPEMLSLAPPTAENPVGTPHTVTATLTQGGNPISGGTILFSVSGANSGSGSDTTDSNGEATFTYTGTNAGGDTITACYDKNTNNGCDSTEATATASKTWTQVTTTPCVVKITNGGWIVTDDGDRGSFGGVAKETIAGIDTGNEEYQDHGPAEPMNVHSISIVDITCDGTTKATIFGVATIDGTGSHPFQIDVEDNGEPGKGRDHYRIRIPDTGYDSGDHILRGGNVQIR